MSLRLSLTHGLHSSLVEGRGPRPITRVFRTSCHRVVTGPNSGSSPPMSAAGSTVHLVLAGPAVQGVRSLRRPGAVPAARGTRGSKRWAVAASGTQTRVAQGNQAEPVRADRDQHGLGYDGPVGDERIERLISRRLQLAALCRYGPNGIGESPNRRLLAAPHGRSRARGASV
jgi:hypothetical protein